jgi:hypothetical protein
MDPISTALTAAWLDAVRRVQSDRVQRLAEIMPDAKPRHDERGLTDAIERGLKSGGAAPLAVAESEKRDGPDSGLTTRLLDVLV